MLFTKSFFAILAASSVAYSAVLAPRVETLAQILASLTTLTTETVELVPVVKSISGLSGLVEFELVETGLSSLVNNISGLSSVLDTAVPVLSTDAESLYSTWVNFTLSEVQLVSAFTNSSGLLQSVEGVLTGELTGLRGVTQTLYTDIYGLLPAVFSTNMTTIWSYVETTLDNSLCALNPLAGIGLGFTC